MRSVWWKLHLAIYQNDTFWFSEFTLSKFQNQWIISMRNQCYILCCNQKSQNSRKYPCDSFREVGYYLYCPVYIYFLNSLLSCAARTQCTRCVCRHISAWCRREKGGHKTATWEASTPSWVRAVDPFRTDCPKGCLDYVVYANCSLVSTELQWCCFTFRSIDYKYSSYSG